MIVWKNGKEKREYMVGMGLIIEIALVMGLMSDGFPYNIPGVKTLLSFLMIALGLVIVIFIVKK